MDSRTLDQILDEINQGQLSAPSVSAGMHDVHAHVVPTATMSTSAPATTAYAGNPGGYQAAATDSVQRTLLGSQTTHNLNPDAPGVLKDELSDRQRRLPKLDLRVMGGALAVFVLVVGVGSATILSGQEQDVRNFASDGSFAQVARTGTTALASPTPAPGAATQVLAQQLTPFAQQLQDPTTMLFITVMVFVVGFIALGAFLFWLLKQDA